MVLHRATTSTSVMTAVERCFFIRFELGVSSLVSFGRQNNVSIDWQSREAKRKEKRKKAEAIKRRMEKLGTVDMKLIIRACIYC